MTTLKMKHLLALATIGVASAAMPQQPFDLDPSFRTNMIGDFVKSVVPLNDDNLLLSGNIRFPGTPNWEFPQSLAKVQPNGSLIIGYPPPLWGVAASSGRITPWQDKYYVYGGDAYRLLTNGDRDTTFHTISGGTGLYYITDQVGDYHVLPDGRLVLGGQYGVVLNHVAQGHYAFLWLTNTGEVDTTRIHGTSTYPI